MSTKTFKLYHKCFYAFGYEYYHVAESGETRAETRWMSEWLPKMTFASLRSRTSVATPRFSTRCVLSKRGQGWLAAAVPLYG